MAAIDQYLQKILEATYGEEVRDSIHDAIKQNYLDITESVNRANAAAAAANKATQNVNAVVSTANQAASTANAASQRATAAATLVEGIEQEYENATAEATAVQPGGAPTATLTDGPNGKKFVFGLPSGATPQIGIGTVTTGAAGSNAEVTISGSADAPNLNFKIPRGDKGETPTVYGNTVPMSPSDSTTVAQAIANATDADAVHSVNGKSATNHAVTVNADDIKMSASDTTNIPNKLKEYVKTVNGTAPDPITGNVNVATGGADSTVGLIRRVIGIAVSDWVGDGPFTYTYPATGQDADIKVGMVVLEDTLSDEYAQLGINTYTVQNGRLTIATTVKPTADWSLDVVLGMDGSSILDDVGDLQNKVGTSTLTTTSQNLSDAVNELDDDLSQQSRQIDEKADIPVIVSVTVNASGPSMSAADQAKFTPDMIMCGYSIVSGDKDNLLTPVEIEPGQTAGTVNYSGTASAQIVFNVAFIHTSNGGGIASVISCGSTVNTVTFDHTSTAYQNFSIPSAGTYMLVLSAINGQIGGSWEITYGVAGQTQQLLDNADIAYKTAQAINVISVDGATTGVVVIVTKPTNPARVRMQIIKL